MDWIRQRLEEFSKRIACHESGRTWSYADFIELIDLTASNLPLEPRKVIAIQTETTIEGIAALLAIAESGHIALPLPKELSKVEQSAICATAAAELLLTSPTSILALTANPDRPMLYDRLKNGGLVLFSSGTSGKPKGMLHDFAALLNRYENARPREDRSLLLLLIDHIGGLDSAFRCFFAGSTLIIPETRTPEASAVAIAKHAANVLPASPSFLNLMLLAKVHESHDLSSLRVIAYGAEVMPQRLLKRLNEAFPSAKLQQKFGTSETGAVRIRSVEADSLYFRIEDADTEWKVVDDLLWLRTPSRILGYLNTNNDSLEADGWYCTGDLVEIAARDEIRIIGRESALINVGGQKVHPVEVESVLNTVPEIEVCRVFGLPDPITGNKVACEIVSQDIVDLRTWKRRIRNHCRGRLAPWKIPSQLELKNQLKLTSRLKQSSD